MRIALVVLIAACGSSEPVRRTPFAPAPPKAAPAPTTCGDAGVILRGTLENAKESGPTKEPAIASACLHDKWPATVLACIGSAPAPQTCLGELAKPQLAGLDRVLRAWADAYGETHEPLTTPEVVAATDCATGIGDVEAYAPDLAGRAGEERDFTLRLRRSTIDALCRSGWPEPVKRCFAAGQPTDICRAQLSADLQRALTDQLAVIEQTVTKALAVRARPAATYDCKKVVAAHYSDTAWNTAYPVPRDPKLAAERKRMIADLRTQMTTACTSERWTATLRACFVAGVGTSCLRGAGIAPDRWSFASTLGLGIAECDTYAARMVAYQSCTQIPQLNRDRTQQLFEQHVAQFRNARADQKAWVVAQCKSADDGLVLNARRAGCNI